MAVKSAKGKASIARASQRVKDARSLGYKTTSEYTKDVQSGKITPVNASVVPVKNSAKKTSETGTSMISSQQGKKLVQDADQTMANLSPISAQPTTPVSEGGQTGVSTPTTTQTPTTPVQDTTKDYKTFVKEATGQEITLRGDAITPEAEADVLKKGFVEASSEISGVKTTPEMAKLKREVESATRESDAFMSRLESMLISDKELAGEIKQIGAKYKARQNEMREINERRQVAMETLGIRTGARYTGGSGGIMGGLLSEEERQGLMRIESIENDKQDAIQAAKTAARNQNFQLYTTLALKAEKKQEEKAKQLQALKVAQAEQDAKIAEEKEQAEYDALIVEQLGTGETDPVKIMQSLAGKVPFDQIKAITDLIPKKEFQFISGTENQASGVFDKTTGTFTRTGGGGGGGGALGGIVPVGKPTVAGIGSKYENSSFEAQMLMDDIMNKIPVQLKNTEKEVALKYEQIRKQLAAGYTYQQIVDRLSGFSLQGTADRPLGNVLYDMALGTDVDAGQLASLLNRGADEQAMTTVENAKLSGAEGFYAQTDKARQTVDQANKVIRLLNEVPSDKLGAFDGKVFKVQRQLTPAEVLKVQSLETALALLNAPLRVAISGTATTASEMEKIVGFQATIEDQPSIINTKVQELRDSVLDFHNQTRSQRGLPTVSTTELTDNKARLNVYRNIASSQVREYTNADLDAEIESKLGGTSTTGSLDANGYPI